MTWGGWGGGQKGKECALSPHLVTPLPSLQDKRPRGPWAPPVRGNKGFPPAICMPEAGLEGGRERKRGVAVLIACPPPFNRNYPLPQSLEEGFCHSSSLYLNRPPPKQGRGCGSLSHGPARALTHSVPLFSPTPPRLPRERSLTLDSAVVLSNRQPAASAHTFITADF